MTCVGWRWNSELGLMDPLQHVSGLSLLPRTFRDLKKNDSNFCSNSSDLKFIHDSMRSMNSRSPNKLSEQANTIIDDVSKLLDTNFASLDTGENPNETRNGNPEDRRQALGRKRPRFSMKPQSSQPAALEPTLDIDKLEDPVEFFLAHEKLENARMELKRLQGSNLSILDEHSPIGAEERRRRPGLLGKTACYKPHTYGKPDNLVVSQETPQQEILSSNHNSQGKVAPICETHERDTISKGSISETERRVNSVLDELLYDKCESLDGNGTLSFLQEHLQIKPIDIDKLCLPDFPDFGKVDFKYVKEKLIKSPKVSSYMQNILKSISAQTPQKDKPVSQSPSSSIASPTPPKNPFASINLMKNTDASDSNKMESTMNVDLDDRSPAEIITTDSIDLSNKFSEIEDTNMLLTSNEMQENVGDMPQEALAQCQHDTNVTKDIDDKTPEKNKPISGNPDSSMALPTLPKNPFASVYCLKRSIPKSKEKSHDASTSLDPFPTREFSGAEHFDQRIIDSDNMETTTNEHVEITVVGRSTPEITACDSIHLSNKCLEMEDIDHVRGAANDNVIPTTPNEMQENIGDVPQEALAQCLHIDVTKSTPMINTSDQTEGQTKVQENVEDKSHGSILANIEFPAPGTSKRSKVFPKKKGKTRSKGQSSSAAVSLHATGEPSKSPVKVSGQEDKLQGPSLASRRNSKKPANDGGKSQSSSAAVSLHATGEPSKSPVKVSGQENKQQEPSLASQRNSKKPTNDGRKRKRPYLRQSLADAGTSWTSGVRRSNRIKMRPLEYWKGERLLYGRVHKSLTTLIGVKYLSPEKGDEKATMKVKSFKDEYTELVELAALH